jgi:hypothetical protein
MEHIETVIVGGGQAGLCKQCSEVGIIPNYGRLVAAFVPMYPGDARTSQQFCFNVSETRNN